LDVLLLDAELAKDVGLDLWREAMGDAAALLSDRKCFSVFIVASERNEEMATADLEDAGQMDKLDLVAQIPGE
jgi:hypothetical protein